MNIYLNLWILFLKSVYRHLSFLLHACCDCAVSSFSMSKNTLFNYFTRSPASQASKTLGSPNSVAPTTPKRPPFKENSVTPKSTPKSANGTSKKQKISNSGSKKTTEKRKPRQLGNFLLCYIYLFQLLNY